MEKFYKTIVREKNRKKYRDMFYCILLGATLREVSDKYYLSNQAIHEGIRRLQRELLLNYKGEIPKHNYYSLVETRNHAEFWKQRLQDISL